MGSAFHKPPFSVSCLTRAPPLILYVFLLYCLAPTTADSRFSAGTAIRYGTLASSRRSSACPACLVRCGWAAVSPRASFRRLECGSRRGRPASHGSGPLARRPPATTRTTSRRTRSRGCFPSYPRCPASSRPTGIPRESVASTAAAAPHNTLGSHLAVFFLLRRSCFWRLPPWY